MKLTKERAGVYRYNNYQIFRWQPETGRRVLWCVAQIHADGKDQTALDDFTTLAKAKQYLMERGN